MAQRPLNSPTIARQAVGRPRGGGVPPLVGFSATKSLAQRLTTPELLADMQNMLVTPLRTKYPAINYSVLRRIATVNKIVLRHVDQVVVPPIKEKNRRWGGARRFRSADKFPYKQTQCADWSVPNGILAKRYRMKYQQIKAARQFWTGKTTHEG